MVATIMPLDQSALFHEIPERFNPVVDILERWAAEDPAATALISIGEQGQPALIQSVAELVLETQRMARALIGLGVGKGDRVLIMMSRVPAWYTAILGSLRLGAVVVPTPAQCTGRDIAYRIRAANPAAIIADESAAMRIRDVVNERSTVKHRILWSPRGTKTPGWHDLNSLLAAAPSGNVPLDPTNVVLHN